MECVGYYISGQRAGTKCVARAKINHRCQTHYNSLLKKGGPRWAADKEIRACIQKVHTQYNGLYDATIYQNARHMISEYVNALPDTETNMVVDITDVLNVFKQRMQEAHDIEMARRDAEANARMARRDADLDAVRRFLQAQEQNRQNVQPQVPGDLGQFANDNQNIHTTRVVNQTVQMVERILNIKIPEGYAWNQITMSKTCGEIILECKLPVNAASLMLGMYVRNDTIYEMGAGIYGRTLDGVWQYICNSSFKEDLCKILRQELVDNIGMCMQGNLTRLCNILAGYMEGFAGVTLSPVEKLGNEIPKLMEIEDVKERLERGIKILLESGLPEENWAAWLDALA